MSQQPAGPPTGNNPTRPPASAPGQGQDQSSMCPLAPTLANPPGPFPTVLIRQGDKIPWTYDAVASQAFNMTGCITDLFAASSNNIEWICPRTVGDRMQMTGGAALVGTSSPNQQEAIAVFEHLTAGQLENCAPPQLGRVPPPMPAADRACALCPPTLTANRVRVTIVERYHYYLHGCLSVGDKKMCSWLDLPAEITCLAKAVVSAGFTCGSGQSMERVNSMHSTVMAMSGLKDDGTGKDQPVKPVISGGSPPPVDNSPVMTVGGGDGAKRWVFIAVPLLAFVGGLSLGAAFLIYRRRRRAERDQHFSQAAPYPLAPLPNRYNVSQATPTPDLAPIPLPTYSSPAVPSAPAAPPAALKPIPGPTVTSFPRPMDTTGLSLIPLVPSADSPGTPEPASLQSLTDAWESLFIRLEHESTQAARAALPAPSIAAVRADRNQRMASTTSRVWAALATGGAVEGDDGGLGEDMRAVMARMGAAYPTFELLGVAGAGVEVRSDAMVEYAAGAPRVGVEARRVVKGMVWPGWFDRARQVVVVRARVVVAE